MILTLILGLQHLLPLKVFFMFVMNENLDSYFDEFDESEFRVERVDEIAHVTDNRLVVEIFGDAAAHSANCLKCVLQRFDGGGVELGTVWNETAYAFSVEIFGVHCDELLQCFVDWERVGLPEFLEWLKAVFFSFRESLPQNLQLKCVVESGDGCRQSLVVVVVIGVTLKGDELRKHLAWIGRNCSVLFVGRGIGVGEPWVVCECAWGLYAPAGELSNVSVAVDHVACEDIFGIIVVNCRVFKVGIRVGIVAGSKVNWWRSFFRGSRWQSDDFPFLVFLLVDFANFDTIPERVIEIKVGFAFGVGFVFGLICCVVSVVRHFCKLVGVVVVVVVVVVCFLFCLSLHMNYRE